ncbi:conserved hypothetical protein [delta proteobacterium NaphS2]|nr:conserved hypothetical protein [delta proteobacterium NaphS2]
MKEESASKIKYGVWGIIVGAIIVMITGFAWGGWTTSGTTQKMADAAVLANQAEICVGQFMAEPNHKENLKELGAMESWKRGEYIEKGGWDKMPGQTEKPDYNVSRACADGLGPLIEKKTDG